VRISVGEFGEADLVEIMQRALTRFGADELAPDAQLEGDEF
jgi:hypothetical protein